MSMDLTAPWTVYRYAVVDVEGNGQQPPDLVEAAVVEINDGEIAQPRNWLVKPPRPITAMARRFHKISDAMVADKPSVAEVDTEIRASLAGRVVVAHNAHVDVNVLVRELPGFEPVQIVDTLKLARRLAPRQASYKLGSLVETFGLEAGGLPGVSAHRAAYDALMCARFLVHLATRHPNLTLSDLLGVPYEEGKDDDAPALF